MLNGCGSNYNTNYDDPCASPDHDDKKCYDHDFDKAYCGSSGDNCGPHGGPVEHHHPHHHHHHHHCDIDSREDRHHMDHMDRRDADSGACGSEMGNAGYPGGPGGGRGDGLGGGLGGYPGGASDWATTPSGNLDADTSALEEQVLLRAPPEVVKDFANKVATEAQSQGNNAAFSFAHNLAQSLTGSFSLANTQKAFDALPTEAGTTLNGHASGANVDFAQADQAGFNQLKKDIQDGNKKAVVNDIQTALKHNEITAADAKTLIGETGMNFHSGIMPGFKTGTEKEADILNGGKKADFS
jgi:hypothetical protein